MSLVNDFSASPSDSARMIVKPALKESDRIGDTAVIRHWDIPDKSWPVEQCGGAKRNSPLAKEKAGYIRETVPVIGDAAVLGD